MRVLMPTTLDEALAHKDACPEAVPMAGGTDLMVCWPEHLERRDAMIQAWRAGKFDTVVEEFQRCWTDGPHRAPGDVDPEVREKVRMMARNGLEHAMEGRLIDPPATERLRELTLPMLMVVGELDMPGILEIADKVVAANPNAELDVIPGVAHMVNMEKPAEFNELLLEYLSRF